LPKNPGLSLQCRLAARITVPCAGRRLASAAQGSSREAMGNVLLGCNAGVFGDVHAVVPGIKACRSFRDRVNHIPAKWPGAHGEAYTVVSLRPDPRDLLAGRLDDQILPLLGTAPSGSQLTVWHEAGNLYKHNRSITPAAIRQSHVKMRNLCRHAGSGVGYGCIIYGTIAEMDKWIPTASYPLDWYGIDIYDNLNSNNGGSFRAADGAVSFGKIKAYLDEYRALAQARTGLRYPRINVCEMNSPRVQYRPDFFKQVARWMNGNGGGQLCTFFKCGGNSGGRWLPDDQPTIDALNHIVSAYGP
jgi:hypothetical protein